MRALSLNEANAVSGGGGLDLLAGLTIAIPALLNISLGAAITTGGSSGSSHHSSHGSSRHC